MRVGVTGIYACGKGTVCEMFRELGALVIDTDIVAREIVEPGAEGLKQIIATFGREFINDDGCLNRREFANYIFQDSARVEKLNAITHPLINKVVLKRSEGPGIYMINAPVLFEAGFDSLMDKNIVVFAHSEEVVDRGVKRDKISADEIKARLNYQIPLKEKMKRADYVIDNSGLLENTKRQVFEIWNILNSQIT